ncbi:MAG: hypothetical protein NC905_06280 [Candidatus Omnitrophica bacterium]|nr:hypothetical protein [Candidatus Omnitrophota bacterium]
MGMVEAKVHSDDIIIFYSNDIETAEKCIKIGIDVILTDRPDILIKIKDGN